MITENIINSINSDPELHETISFYKRINVLAEQFPNLSKFDIFNALIKNESSSEPNVLSFFTKPT